MIHDLDLLLHLVPRPSARSRRSASVSLAVTRTSPTRIEFEDGCVANVTASRASYQAVRKMRLWGAEGYATLDFGSREATWSARRKGSSEENST